MMMKPYPLHILREKTELIPHAVLSVSVWDIANEFKFDIEKGEDDFDRYFGFGAISDFGYPFAIMHYRGYPENTSTIYLPRDFGSDLKKITEAVHSIATELTHSNKLLLWERKDDPDL